MKEIWQSKRSELKITQQDVANEIGGITQGAISHYLNGKNPLNLKIASVFSRLLGVPISKFSFRLAKEKESLGIVDAVSNIQEEVMIQGWLPLISWVQAGEWSEAIDLYEPGYSERVVPTSIKHSNKSFALRVEGDSMTLPEGIQGRSFPHGMIIYVDPERDCNDGDFVVARLLSTYLATFKRLAREEGRPVLMPQNPDRKQYPIIRDEFELIGRVIDASWGGL